METGILLPVTGTLIGCVLGWLIDKKKSLVIFRISKNESNVSVFGTFGLLFGFLIELFLDLGTSNHELTLATLTAFAVGWLLYRIKNK